MTIEERAARAVELKAGCNCAQAAALAFADVLPLDEATLMKLAAGYGAGMGCMEATCGAIIGAVNVLGAINKNPQKTMKSARNIITAFKAQNGTVICKELKGIEDGVVKRECIDCVRDAAGLLEKELNQDA